MKVSHASLALLVVMLLVTVAVAEVPTIVVDGQPYVDLGRFAADLKARMETTDDNFAELHTSRHVVRFTRNWARILIDGTATVLDAPARVRDGRWLVPKSFVTNVMPRLAASSPPPAAPARPAATAPPPPAPPPATARPTAPAPPATASLPPAATPAPTARPTVPASPPTVTPPPATTPPPAASPSTPAAAPRATAITLEEMRVRSYPAFTRVVLETSAPITHKLDSAEGSTVRVRLPGLSGRPRAEDVADGFVDSVKLNRAGNDGVLVVGFTGTPGELKASTLSDPPRLVLDFMKPSEKQPRVTAQTAAPLRTIVLDAGHGGHDPGAAGPGGLTEKELVLDVTKRVAKLITDRLDIKVLLSRDGDHFVPLKDRTSFANKERADLFVSIHANAHSHASHEGVETYFLSTEATDIAARRTAALENSVVQLEKPAAAARGGNGQDLLRAVLWDLAQSDFLVESSHLAEVVQDSMTRSLRIPNRGVKQAGFYVLGGAAMPAILIEIGFLTNPKEERRLRDSKYRDEIARAILAGIAEYKRHWDQRMRATAEKTR